MTTQTRTTIAKLYKRCKWGKHNQCPGHFEEWSVCSCECHTPADAAEITIANEASAAIAEAQAIITPPATVKAVESTLTPSWGKSGSLRERTFTPCPKHAPAPSVDLDEQLPVAANRTLRMVMATNGGRIGKCAECDRLTLANARAYAIHLADKPMGLKLQGVYSSVTIPRVDVRGWHSKPARPVENGFKPAEIMTGDECLKELIIADARRRKVAA